ncbi:MAG: Flp pilus assembly complex ATPase component TadA [Candidatus Marsarchaeota archaeon]|nr:Flp pilus assembly complex ATPase component TadA [Candidatus Marsarchaeota archaeon]
MNPDEFYNFESKIFSELESRLSLIPEEADRAKRIETIAKSVAPAASPEDIRKVIADSKSFDILDKYLDDEKVEDIMINNTSNLFVYTSGSGYTKEGERVASKKDLDMLVKKLKMYATTSVSNQKIFDVHLPNGSRANIVDSPMGADITVRNFKRGALSIIDLINNGELSYNLAGRLWLYTEGLKVRPANLLIGGMPASGKTTLLNAMFSFFRPEQRVVVIEETYELNTETQENTVRLETSPSLPMEELVKNSLRMRPDLIIIGEVRGPEAKDMLTAMNIGKISMGTIHASTARDVITRLEHSPMNIEMDIIPLIDAIIIVSQVNEATKLVRKVTQVSEISGLETQVLLSDLYSYDYKTHKSSDVLPSVTYRDTLAKLTGYTPTEIVIEEQRRGKILERLNKLGIKDLKGINAFVKEYYQDPKKALAKIDLANLGTLPW